MKVIRLLLVAVMAVAFDAKAVVYLKPLGAEEARGAVDGASWATAYTTVQDAVNAIADAGCVDKTIYAAKGVYFITATISNLPAGFAIYGGFAGEEMSETPDSRDLKEDQTIFTSDTKGALYWVKRTPTLGAHAVVDTKLTSEKCIVDDKISPPPAWGEGDDFVAYGVSANTVNAFAIAAAAYGTFDGVRFIGFARTLDYAGANATDASALRNCAVYGGAGNDWAQVMYQRTAPLTISDSEFSYGYCWWRCTSLYSTSSALTMERVSFVGNQLKGTGYAHGLICSVAQATLTDCTFTHCQSLHGTNGSPGLFGCGSGTATLTDCVFSNNYVSASVVSEGAMMVSVKKGTFTKCLFADNRAEAKVGKDVTMTLFGIARPGNVYSGIENVYDSCVFARNAIAAVREDGSSGDYALGIVGHGQLYAYTAVSSGGANERLCFCVFDGNSATALDSETLTGVLSRGVVASAAYPVCKVSELSVTNCTFTGSSAVSEGIHDVVQFGSLHTKNLSVVNSVFAGAAMPSEPCSFSMPSLVALSDCHVKNMTAAPAGVTASGLYLDDVPMNSDYTPTVRAPGLTEIVPFGAATIRGAVQEVLQPAGTYAVAVRREPFDYGTFGDVATTVAVGGNEISYTATPQAGATFAGWFYANGTLFSSSATIVLSTENITADTVLTARFETPKIKITFDLGEAGTFASTGLSVSNLYLAAQAAFPAAPTDIVANDGWYIVPNAWTPAIPSVVPGEDTVYAARAVVKTVRIVRYDSRATGTGDGSSWANAYTDFGAALADAQTYRGEVWVKGGVHFISPVLTTVHSVNDGTAIRGGYLGDDNDDAARDVAERPSVLTGDLSGNDSFKAYDRAHKDLGIKKDGDGNTLLVMNADGTFNLPLCTGDERYFIVQNTSENVEKGFALVAEGPDIGKKPVFDGLTLTGFRRFIIDSGTAGVPFITNCTFRGRQYVAAKNGAYVVDSRFVGGDSGRGYADDAGILFVNGQAGVTTVCERVTFDSLTSEYGGAYRPNSEKGFAIARGCVFRDVRQFGRAIGYGSGVAIASTAGILEECLFERCDSFGAGPVVNVYGQQSVMSNCLFRYCRVEGWINGGSMRKAAVLAGVGNYTQAYGVSFVSNTVLSCGTEDEKHNAITNKAHVVGLGYYTTIANGTFLSNELTAEGAVGNVASVIVATGNTYGGVVGTTFADNVAANGVYCEYGRTSASPWLFVGNIIWNRDNVAPFTRFGSNESATTGVKVYNSVVRNFSASAEPILDSEGVMTENPRLDLSKTHIEGTRCSVKPTATSSASRAGAPVFVGERSAYSQFIGGDYVPLYVNRGTKDAPSYLNLVTTATVQNPTIVGALGDILGRVRRQKRPSAGSTESDPCGLMMIIR